MRGWIVLGAAAWGAVAAMAAEAPLSGRQAAVLATAYEVAATNRPQAIAMAEGEIEKDAAAPSAFRLMAAQLYNAEGLFTNAVPHFRAALRQEPQNADALVGLGRALLGLSQSVSAETAYRGALLAAENDATRNNARSGLIHALVAQSRLHDAETVLAEHIAANPDDASLRLLQAQLRDARGDAAGAAISRECAQRLARAGK